MNAAPDPLFGQFGKPALDQIQPGSRSGSEVQVEAGTFGQPAANQLRLVRAVVVQDEMYVQFRRHILFDGIEKSAELARAMTTMQLSQHAATGHVSRRSP
jgi:hypothetical protein